MVLVVGRLTNLKLTQVRFDKVTSEQVAAIILQRSFSNLVTRQQRSLNMVAFYLNPYDQALNLMDKGHLKLYTDGCEGLPEKIKFDGKIDKYKDFVKLIGELMDKRRVKGCLKVPTVWETTGTPPELPTEEGLINIFERATVEDDKLTEYCDLVWSDADFASTPKLFKIVTIKPTNDNTLNQIRNQARLKHAMLGQMICNSLSSKLQLQLIGRSSTFKVGEEYCGVKLWAFICKEVNPTTATGASGLKEEIEHATLKDFKHDVKDFNTNFEQQGVS